LLYCFLVCFFVGLSFYCFVILGCKKFADHFFLHINSPRTLKSCFGEKPVFVWGSYVNFSWFVLKSHVSRWNSTCARVNHTRACQNHTLRVEITLVRVKIAVVSVVITFMRFNITLRLEITLCVWKSHSTYIHLTRACLNHHSMRVNITYNSDFYTQSVVLTRMSLIIAFESVIITHIRVNVWCWNHSRKCRTHICACQNYTACQNQTACGNYTHLRVEITLFVQKLHSCVWTS
jgi:hypothetical protein